ncbi:MAG: hypothetical protein K9J06_10215 [Flavobacteriales bacterium]|nr:hypothetical protein [Flavobacteriales bacterium]
MNIEIGRQFIFTLHTLGLEKIGPHFCSDRLRHCVILILPFKRKLPGLRKGGSACKSFGQSLITPSDN